MNKERYISSVAFKKALAGKHEGFDYEASMRLHRNHFATKDGKVYKARASAEMWRMLNECFGDFIDVKRSIYLSPKWIITYLEEQGLPPVVDTVGGDEGEVPAESETTDAGQGSEPSSEEYSSEYAASLLSDDAKDSKTALEEYGKLFGIDLKKNKSFPNMLKDLEAHVSK